MLDRCWRYPVTAQSNFGRKHGDIIALAASMGLITTRIKQDVYGKTWLITPKGLEWIFEND